MALEKQRGGRYAALYGVLTAACILVRQNAGGRRRKAQHVPELR